MDKKTLEDISFGEWLRQRRHILDLTQQELANQVGCARITLRRIESGNLKPSKELANILLENMGVPSQERPEWILFARGMADFPNRPVQSTLQQELKTNVPFAITSFVGREKDIERIKRRLSQYRLVTLTGTGGIGKTRLAQEVANLVSTHNPDGAWFVELASLSDPALVPQMVAGIFGIQARSDRPLIEVLIQVLRNKKALLILDNCEHLLYACAQLCDGLLKNCPGLKILATSREALGVLGEALYPVPALTIANIKNIESLAKLNDYEAIRLFVERAQLVHMDFALTTENALSVAQLCHRLDGIPLAIELAAARINILQVEEILKQLDVCFSVLASHTRTAVPRHQTLRASLDWSWSLLSEAEQIFMRQLSVFAGSWTVESAQAVCEGDSLNLISSMLRKSLIIIDQKLGAETRYHFHEIVHQYAGGKLTESGEEANIRTRHLKYYLQVTEQAELALNGPTQVQWYSRLMAERNNIRAALEWAEKTDVKAGLYLAGRVHIFWEDLAVREGARWLSIFIEKPESHAYPLARARALLTQGWLLQRLQQFDLAHSAARECLELYRACYDQHGEIDALGLLAVSLDVAQAREYLDRALSLSQGLKDQWREADILGKISWLDHEYKDRRSYQLEAITLFREVGDWRMLALYLAHLAELEMLNGDLESAQKSLDEALEMNERLNNEALRGDFLGFNGRLAFINGDYQRARVHLQEAVTVAEALGNRMHYLWWRTHLGYVAVAEGKLTDAQNLFTETMQNFLKDQSEIGVVFALEGMAGLYTKVHKPEDAARLIGWADAMREKLNDTRPLMEQTDLDKVIRACVAKTGKGKFSEAYKHGSKMSLAEAVAYVLREK